MKQKRVPLYGSTGQAPPAMDDLLARRGSHPILFERDLPDRWTAVAPFGRLPGRAGLLAAVRWQPNIGDGFESTFISRLVALNTQPAPPHAAPERLQAVSTRPRVPYATASRARRRSCSDDG